MFNCVEQLLNLTVPKFNLIDRQPGIAVLMPTPINQLFNDESIAVQIICLDVYTWNYPWIKWNTGLIGDGSKFQ